MLTCQKKLIVDPLFSTFELEVDSLELHTFRKNLGYQGQEIALVSLKVGSLFDVNNIFFWIDISAELELMQDWSGANVDFTKSRYSYLQKSQGEIEPANLSQCFFNEIGSFLVSNNYSSISHFLYDEESLSLSSFVPQSWQGGKLVIPVYFLGITNFQKLNDDKITANIQYGHEIIFPNVEIFNYRHDKGLGFFDTGSILDSQLINSLNEIIFSSDEIREYVEKIISEPSESLLNSIDFFITGLADTDFIGLPPFVELD